MAKKRETQKKGLDYHLLHKTKLILLLVLKVFLVLVSFFAVMALLSLLSPWASFSQTKPLNIVMWIVGTSIAVPIYLFMIIRILKILKFDDGKW